MTNPNFEQLHELVENANANPEDPSTNRLLIAQEVAELGFFMIGTAESQAVRHPTKQTYYDRNFKDETGRALEVSIFNDPDIKFTRATWSGKLAIEGAVLGDFNIRHQRALLGKPLTSTPKFYGWECRAKVLLNRPDLPELTEDLLFPHAEQALLNKVDDSVEGYIDIVHPIGFSEVFDNVENPETKEIEQVVTYPGVVFHMGVLETITSLTVRGSDLWYTDINSREYNND